MVKCRSAGLVRLLGRPGERKYALDHGIFVIAAAGDRLHGRGIEPAIDDETVVDMDADHLAEYDVAIDRHAVGRFHGDDLDELAFERAWRGGYSRRFDQPRWRGCQSGALHLVDAMDEGCRCGVHGLA